MAKVPLTNKRGGRSNWVEKAGGLDPYLRRIAEHLKGQGMSDSHAIAAAWATLRRWARGGGDVKPETRAKAIRALANMERKRRAGRGRSLATANAATLVRVLELTRYVRTPEGAKFFNKPIGSPITKADIQAAKVIQAKRFNAKFDGPQGPKKPIKKNSVEYWQRAHDLTVAAQSKHAPDSKNWQKFEMRRLKQEAMVAHMKEWGTSTLTEAEFDEHHAKVASLKAHMDKPIGSTHEEWTPHKQSEYNDLVAAGVPPAKAKDMVFAEPAKPKVSGGGADYAPKNNGPVESTAGMTADQIHAAKVAKLKKMTTIAPDDVDQGAWDVEVASASFKAKKFDETYYVYQGPMGYPIHKDQPPSSKYAHSDTDVLVVSPDGTSKMTTLGEINKSSSAPMVGSGGVTEATKAAKAHDKPMYTLMKKDQSFEYTDSLEYAKKNNTSTMLLQVNPDGTKKWVDTKGGPAPEPGTQTSLNIDTIAKAKSLENNPRVPKPTPDTAAGGDVPLDLKDNGTRPIGLDAIFEGIHPYVQGTPEGDALRGRYLPNEHEVASHYRAAKVSMPSTAKSAARSYTASSHPFNDPLRGQGHIDAAAQKKIHNLDTAAAAYKTSEPMFVNRGLANDVLPKGSLEGKLLQDSGFVSTAFGKPFGNTVQMHIFVPAGTHGVSVDGLFDDGGTHPGEREFILPRGSTFMISRDMTDAAGVRHITATVVPTPLNETKSGIVPVSKQVSSEGYTAKGLEFLRVNGREKWAKRYAAKTALALSNMVRYDRDTKVMALSAVLT